MAEKRCITFKYKFAEDYNPFYVNGAQGGILPNGDLAINFYLERLPLPNEQDFEIDEKGTIGSNPVRNEPHNLESSMIRMVQSGVIMNSATAEALYNWLGQQIDSLHKIQDSKLK